MSSNKKILCPIAVLTGTVGSASKRSLVVRHMVSGPVPCSGALSATEQGAGRSQHRSIEMKIRSAQERSDSKGILDTFAKLLTEQKPMSGAKLRHFEVFFHEASLGRRLKSERKNSKFIKRP